MSAKSRPKFISDLSKTTKIFFGQESAAGIVMLSFALLALIIANTTLYEQYSRFISSSVSLGFGHLSYMVTFNDFVKEVLMVFFFFNIGMELKKEMVAGFLTKVSQVISPLIAAFCGMLFPALIYVALNHGNPVALHGWAIPCATDIAFALCVLILAGRNVNPTIKIFLLAIAVFDDIGSILIIAFFYGSGISATPLGLGLIIISFMFILNRLQVSSFVFYGILGALLWLAFHKAGISTSIAGVITGMLIPYHCVISDKQEVFPINDNLRLFTPWVNFFILPIFAFVESGVNLTGLTASDFTSPIALGVATGLFFGKQIGIFGSTLIMIKLKLCQFPKDVRLHHIYAISLFSGIGFTMSLFVSKLSFTDPAMLDMSKIGIIASALLSSLFGIIALNWNSKSKAIKTGKV